MTELTDYQLIEEILKNEEAWPFEELYARYKGPLYGILCSMLTNDRASVDDVFQKTWLKVLEKLPDYKHKDRFSAWLFTIGHNLALDELRKVKRRSSREMAMDDDMTPRIRDENAEQGWVELHRSDLKVAVNTALEGLPPEQREVVLLRQNQLSFKEIAAIQDCSINTALARMQYAMKNMRKLLAEYE